VIWTGRRAEALPAAFAGYHFGMRETAVLVVSVVLIALGFSLGCALRPKTASPTQYASSMREDTSARIKPPVTKVLPAVAPAEPIDANSSPEVVHDWRRKEKDEILRRVANLSSSEAENLCFHLRLIARDEVFDKVNVKGRLKRYVDGLHTDAELADVEAGFGNLEDHH